MDAYTLRKIAPRLLIAVIGINLSIYLCVAAIDITNIIGNGIGGLLRGPFLDTDSFQAGGDGIPIQPNTENTIVGVVGVGAIGVIIAALIAVPGAGAVAAGGALAVLGLILPLLVTALLLAIAVLVVVVIRYGLLVFLSVISPVAIACFILPGTEKYFRQWWDLFVKTLLIYPIIAAFFAMSDILAAIFLQSTASDANGDGLGLVTLFVTIIALLAPLFLIPFAFVFAGGIIGTVMGRAGVFARQGSDMLNKTGYMQRRRRNLQHRGIEMRAEAAQSIKNRATGLGTRGDRGFGRVRRGLLNTAARGIGGYNIEARASAARAEIGKEINDQIATGRDEEIRGLTVNKQWALNSGLGAHWDAGSKSWVNARTGAAMSDSEVSQADYLVGENGARQFRSLGGRLIDEADVDQGYRRWGDDTFAQQAALSYEMRKAQSDHEVARVSDRFRHVAKGSGGWGMSDDEAKGAFIGAGFENQGTNLEYKYTDALTGKLNHKGYTSELYEKRGSFDIARLSAHNIEKLKESYDQGDAQTKAQVKAIAESFTYRGGAPRASAVPGEEGEPTPGLTPHDVQEAQQAGARGAVQTSATGPAHVNEAIRNLSEHVGVYQAENPNDINPQR